MISKISKPNIGSEWRKWDLHVHSPLSISQNYGGDKEDVWNKFILDLEKLPDEVKIIGINDYLFLDGYEKVLELKESERLNNIDLILPVLEFRLKEFSGVDFGEYTRPNLHVIFADQSILDIDDIKSQFLDTLSAKYKIEKDGILFQRKLDRKSLIEFGQTIINSAPKCQKSKYETPIIEGFNNLNITLEQVQESLNKDCFNGKYFLAIGKTEWDKLKWSDHSIASKKTLINSCQFVFTSSESVEKFQNAKQKLKEQNVNDLLLDCSDAHNFSDSKDKEGNFIKDRIGKCFTWIKSEPTFEGLKQIVYEPETRISITGEKPKKPINTINALMLQIPVDSKVGDDKFCFAGNKNTYELSPYFNCFIGGRGSGKSTILNFLGLHSNNPDSPKKFWDDLSPSFDPNNITVFSFQGTEIFEFLAQSEIETFAKDKAKFTQAIYDRANGPNKTLQQYEDDIIRLQNELEKIIKAVLDLNNLKEQKKIKEKEKRSLESTRDIIEGEDYKKITIEISQLSQKLQIHKNWLNEIYLLKTQLADTVEFYSKFFKDNSDNNKYKDQYLLAVDKVKEAIQILDEENFDDLKNEEKASQTSLLLLEKKLKDMLDKIDLSEENIEQIKSAPQKITALDSEIKYINYQIEIKDKIIALFNDVVSKISFNKKSYEEKIIEILKPLRELLEKHFEDNQGKDIKQISLEYSFDENGAWIAVASEFYNHFRTKYGDSERSKEVCEFIIEKKLTFSSNAFDEIKGIVQKSKKNDKKYIKFVDEVFKDQNNFQIFQAIRDKHLYDVKTNKIIRVKYDNRDVEQASFGQRCTAVVVILLLFGNYPLIIDEPEAHLDSSLIANYLVPLLKEKKSDRQIIFATHNANFVINGDAEKIFILKNESGQTEVIETTIEDIKNREELLKLEGGREAFRKRGEKLHI